MKYVMPILLIVVCFSCSKPEHDVKMNEANIDQFFNVFSSFIDLMDDAALDSLTRVQKLDSALTLHSMQRADFDSTRIWLENNPQIFYEHFKQFDDSLRTQRVTEVKELP